MPDTTVPPSGKDTSEFSLTKLLALAGVFIAASLPVLAGLTSTLDGLQTVFPGAKWIGVALGVVGTLMTVAMTINKYIGSRTQVKIAQTVQAVQTSAGNFDASKPVPQ